MASNRFTLASNVNRSIKAPLIVPISAIPNPASTSSIRALVLKTANSKLRLKKGSRIFLADSGHELQTEDDWRSLPVDATLLVSSGEDFVGAAKPNGSARHPDANQDCPVRVIADVSSVESTSIAQLEAAARTLPGIVYAVGLPDLHPGTKFPIGAALVSRNWIHPPLIGSDIGCGMAWYTTTLSRRNLDGDKAKRITERLRGVEKPWRGARERRVWLSRTEDGDCAAGDPWDTSVGTIGAGNHFAELQIIEHSSASDTLPATDSVVLLIHSGSRGFGGDVLRRFTTPPPAESDEPSPSSSSTSLPVPSARASAYLSEHDKACAWASLNRDLIALRFLACLEPHSQDWAFEGSDDTADASSFSDADVRAAIAATKQALAARKVVDICHNSLEKLASWPPASEQAGQEGGDIFYLHRKGAAPSNLPSNPIIPLPGSRGTATLLLRPRAGPAESSALSVAHGAGRAMSRAKAATYVAQKYKGQAADLLRGDEHHDHDDDGQSGRGKKVMGGGRKVVRREVQGLMERMGIGSDGRGTRGGTWVVCEDKSLVWEEAPEAYKDVWEVGADLEGAGAAEVVGWAKGRISYKVRKE